MTGQAILLQDGTNRCLEGSQVRPRNHLGVFLIYLALFQEPGFHPARFPGLFQRHRAGIILGGQDRPGADERQQEGYSQGLHEARFLPGRLRDAQNRNKALPRSSPARVFFVMDRLYLLRPEGLGLNHPGYQVTQVVVTSFEISRQLFNRLLIGKFKRTAKRV